MAWQTSEKDEESEDIKVATSSRTGGCEHLLYTRIETGSNLSMQKRKATRMGGFLFGRG